MIARQCAIADARKARARGRAKGFTMVELLVVIGIIIVLLAILLPAINRARRSAQSTKCLSNLRQIGVALVSYYTDCDGYLPPAGYTDGTHPYATKDGIFNQLVDKGYLKVPIIPFAQRDATPPTAEETVFKCPNGLEESLAEGQFYLNTTPIPNRQDSHGAQPTRYYSSFRDGYVDVWYAINAVTGPGDSTFNAFPMRRLESPDFRLCRFTRIKNPALMVVMMDGALYNLSNAVGRIHARHGAGKGTQTNVAFYDGHAATFDADSLPTNFNSVATLNDPKYGATRWRLDQP